MPLRKEPKASQQPHLSPGTGAEPGAFPCQDSQQCEQNTGSALQTGAAPRKKHVSYIRHSCFHCHNGLLRWSPSFVLLPDTHLSCRLLPPLAFDTGFAPPTCCLSSGMVSLWYYWGFRDLLCGQQNLRFSHWVKRVLILQGDPDQTPDTKTAVRLPKC